MPLAATDIPKYPVLEVFRGNRWIGAAAMLVLPAATPIMRLIAYRTKPVLAGRNILAGDRGRLYDQIAPPPGGLKLPDKDTGGEDHG